MNFAAGEVKNGRRRILLDIIAVFTIIKFHDRFFEKFSV